jgi:replicative DNA helicase
MSLTASDFLTAPVSPESEWRVLAALLTTPERIPEMIGVPLEQEDFSSADTRVIFSAVVERHFAGKPIDALILAETIRAELAQFWSAEPSQVGALMEQRTRDALGSDENLTC